MNDVKIVAVILTIIVCLGLSSTQDDCGSKKFELDKWASKFKYQDTVALDVDQSVANQILTGGIANFYKELDPCFYKTIFKEFRYESMVLEETKQNINPITKQDYDANWERFKEPLYCYSISEWNSNVYLLVILTEGKYFPNLSLISCDKNGKFNAGTLVRQQFVDAGRVDITKSEIDEGNLLISYITEHETHENGYGETIIDSTVTPVTIKPDGMLSKGVAKNYSRRIKW